MTNGLEKIKFSFCGTMQHAQFCQRSNLEIPHIPHSLGYSNGVGLEHFCPGFGREGDGLVFGKVVPGSVYGSGSISGTYTHDFLELCRKYEEDYILLGDWGWKFFFDALKKVKEEEENKLAYENRRVQVKILKKIWRYGGGFHGQWVQSKKTNNWSFQEGVKKVTRLRKKNKDKHTSFFLILS